uniref:glutamate decarboxylase n=1 Tax=Timspurckia oligopyrenoides TaxID=708627 RepID=A0A7S0ZF53_9RHOD|mmetsp:Transcript_2835/g.4985  ORF Transcript_2835/g.4985 Transcript_2835/m.4985 type:complete len:581 (+) Transcript_2835:108-1850(+)
MDSNDHPKADSGHLSEIEHLKARVEDLEQRLRRKEVYYYASETAQQQLISKENPTFPKRGMPGRFAENIIRDYHQLDFNERLNTSSYVNVTMEIEEERVACLGMKINIADQTVYPATFMIHDHVVNMLADLWNAPKNSDAFLETGVHAGAGTVGSTEACLLAALALKFRWRKWYAAKYGLTDDEVRKEYPNIVISSMYQAAHAKSFKYLDIMPKLIHPQHFEMVLNPDDVKEAIDDHTIGVVCILGNHYSGHYDPVEEIDSVIRQVNEEKGYQVGIHVDGASGAFIAPFDRSNSRRWNFELPTVLSISASGHKFGESVAGTGWVVWRQRKDLSEHVAISVSYLGGNADSYTLNFSRPASGIMVQFYKILRLGWEGYSAKVRVQMSNAKVIRDALRQMTFNGKPRFVMLDNGDEDCLPVVAAMLNPSLNLPYDDIDLQHTISDDHWYVCGYRMQYDNPLTGELTPLFSDMKGEQSMFRIVVKSNLTREMAVSLCAVIDRACHWLDDHLGTGLASESFVQFNETADQPSRMDSALMAPLKNDLIRRATTLRRRDIIPRTISVGLSGPRTGSTSKSKVAHPAC